MAFSYFPLHFLFCRLLKVSHRIEWQEFLLSLPRPLLPSSLFLSAFLFIQNRGSSSLSQAFLSAQGILDIFSLSEKRLEVGNNSNNNSLYINYNFHCVFCLCDRRRCRRRLCRRRLCRHPLSFAQISRIGRRRPLD